MCVERAITTCVWLTTSMMFPVAYNENRQNDSFVKNTVTDLTVVQSANADGAYSPKLYRLIRFRFLPRMQKKKIHFVLQPAITFTDTFCTRPDAFYTDLPT